MSDLRPVSIPALPHDADDPRVGNLLGSDTTPDAARVVLVGFPTDDGVRRNGGRPGAAQGPEAIRRALWNLTPDTEQFDTFCELLRHTADLGDVAVTGDLEADQAALGRVLAPHLARGAVAV